MIFLLSLSFEDNKLTKNPNETFHTYNLFIVLVIYFVDSKVKHRLVLSNCFTY